MASRFSNNSTKSVVLVTGATGWIAQHVIHDLLETQCYRVIGTARTRGKCNNLLQSFGNTPLLTMEVVSDLSLPSAFDPVFKKNGNDIEYVLHMASPVYMKSTDYQKVYLEPALNGTRSLLEAIEKYGSKKVRHVVYTSSVAAMFKTSQILAQTKNNTSAFGKDNFLLSNYDENSWNPDSWTDCQTGDREAYAGSKKFAEKFAWDYVHNHKVNYTFNTINPVWVLGPQVFAADVGNSLLGSNKLIANIVKNSGNNNFTIDYAFKGLEVDVRDVSRAHLASIKNGGKFNGHRLLMYNGEFTLKTIISIINSEFPKEVLNIPSVKVKEMDDDYVKPNYKPRFIDNSKTMELLGFDLISFEKTVKDSVVQMVENHLNTVE
ncbi:related to carbonyl reductase (NADPH-dependent) [Saccharomycodes ludwigii]|uniref:Related to carbonyl reductase (NADPH-dependent) n=1 Tax=Saccharomycodes ludwigii TaxID=36035 RepID=A0A376B9I8_9ASCO|nr:hypothetical protein SCDLUD_004521 [Saccharomycodes ludwigii]KAH3899097.1 hypothetical protein SCDLUD_004521 [Saccharomycodes ludwigii]SSD60790.1 related to carbonyl reductase (NADPH-dependent) [Saccharomycodes ludwigii]